MDRDADRPAPSCVISMAGAGALLVDCADGPFAETTQRRIWAMAASLRQLDGVREALPGMNNLLVVFDPLVLAPAAMEETLRVLWRDATPDAVSGKTIEIPVIYGGARGEDLPMLADHCGLSVDEVIHRHAAGTYCVAALGAMAGFPYLSGLDPSLTMGRRTTPRLVVAEGSVITAAGQAGIMPCTAPSGWHIIGHTPVRLFDPATDPPTLLHPGDTVRFTIVGIDR